MSSAYEAYETLITRFKKEHGRGERVELTLASSGDLAAPVIEIRVKYSGENEADARWFKEAVKSI